MVTHDTSLKTYASRIVRMLDGKINKDEQIDSNIRENSYQQLKLRVYTYLKTEGGLGVKSGVGNENISKRTFKRKPTDYEAVRF